MVDTSSLEVNLLGGFRITAGHERLVGFDQARVQQLLVYLLLHRRVPCSRQQIAFAFWPDTPDKQALKNLRTLLARMRQSLPDADRYLDVSPHTLQWRHDAPNTLDIVDFEDACAQAAAAQERADSAEELAALKAAADIYGGDLLAGWYDEWLVPERERLRQTYLEVLERLSVLLKEKHSYKEALGYAQRLVRADPLHEAVYRQLMQLHLALGDRANALRVYHTCATILRHELGVDPGSTTQAVYQQVLMRNADLPGPASYPQTATGAIFVGRQTEWKVLLDSWRAAEAGRAQLVLISGEAGMGKTRLAEELLAWAERQDVETAVARCYATGDSLVAYAPVAEWLRSAALRARTRALDDVWIREVARLLPDLLSDRPELPAPGPMTESWQRQRFFQALAQVVLRTPMIDFDERSPGRDGLLTGTSLPGQERAGSAQPLLLFLDDVQWCDQKTLDWLQYLLQAAGSVPLLVLGTVRIEEVGKDHPLAAFRLMLEQRAILRELRLSPLTMAETASLAADLGGRELTSAKSEQLFHDTEGNPLFVVETVRAELGDGETGRQWESELTDLSALPPKIRAVIRRRLSMVSPDAQALVQTAAVIGREFSFDVLASACSQDETVVVQSLDELWRKHLVREQGLNAYDFSHDKIRAVAHADVSPIRRRAIHLSVAQALETHHATDLDSVSSQIAGHLEQAGRPRAAIAYYRRAAAVAQRIYANAEAIRLYQHLLEGKLRNGLSASETCALMLALGEVWRVNGQWHEAEAINRQALEAAETLGKVALQAQAQRALANVMRLQGHYDTALEWLAKAELGFESTGEWRGVVSALWTMAEIYWFKGDNKQALATLERQLRIAGEFGDQRGICEALNTMGMVYWSQGDWDASADCCRRSIAVAEPLGYHLVVTRATLTLGNVCMSQHKTGDAVHWYLRAGLLARQIDDRQALSWAVDLIANILTRHGDHLQALGGYEWALRNSLAIGDRWSACLDIANIGAILEGLRRPEHATALIRRAIDFGRQMDVPSYLCGMLIDLARLMLEQDCPAEALSCHNEAVEMASRVAGQYLAGSDARFDLQVMGIRLHHALGELTDEDTVAELQAMLRRRPTRVQQAALHYELWRLAPDNQTALAAAAELYRSLYLQTGLHEQRQRYQQLIGETLPDPPPLPDVSELIPVEPVDLDGLDARLEPLLAQLDASFNS